MGSQPVDAQFHYPARASFFASDPADLLTQGFDSIRVQKRVSRTADWKEVKNSTVYLESDRHNYTFVDPEAHADYEYRAVLQNSENPADPPEVEQPPTRAVDDRYDQIMSIQEFKQKYLWGQDSGFITDDGDLQPDYTFVRDIMFGIRKVERALDLTLLPERRVERLDWIPEDVGRGYMRLSTDKCPIISVESMTLNFPGGATYAIPAGWLRVGSHPSRVVTVVPDGEFALTLTSPGLRFYRNRFVPQAIELTYTAGFTGAIPDDLLEVIGMEAAMGPLNVAGDLVGGAGLAGTSLSADGLSESVTTTNSSTNAGFGARLLQYSRQLKSAYRMLIPYWKGIGMSVG